LSISKKQQTIELVLAAIFFFNKRLNNFFGTGTFETVRKLLIDFKQHMVECKQRAKCFWEYEKNRLMIQIPGAIKKNILQRRGTINKQSS